MGNRNYEASLGASVTPIFEASRSTNLGALGDRYQAERVVKEWLKKAGAPPKKGLETREGGAPTMDVSYKEAYAMNPQQARMKLVETHLTRGSIAETARRWHTSRNLVRKWVRRFEEEEGLPGLQDRSRRPRSFPSQTPEEIEAKVWKARERTGYGRKDFPGTCGRRKAWFSRPTRSGTSCGAWATPAGERGGKPSILPTGLGRRNGRLRWSRWT